LNERADINALRLLLSSKARRTNLVRVEAQEVIDENSSPDLLDDDSGINGVRLKTNIVANLISR